MMKLKIKRTDGINNVLYFFLFAIGNFSVTAQVGIGTSAPNPSAKLEITTTAGEYKGILIPRIPLLGLTDTETIDHGNIESLLVYNTAVTSSLSPGYYYWNSHKWNRLLIKDDIPQIVQSQPGKIGVPQIPGSNQSGAPAAGTVILNNDDGFWVYEPEKENWMPLRPNLDNYSFTEQPTGRSWVDGTKVLWKTIEVQNLTQGNEVFDLSNAFGPDEINSVLSARVINKNSNGISTAVFKYDVHTNKLLMGNGMVMPTPHDIGTYYIVLEYIKEGQRPAAP